VAVHCQIKGQLWDNARNLGIGTVGTHTEFYPGCEACQAGTALTKLPYMVRLPIVAVLVHWQCGKYYDYCTTTNYGGDTVVHWKGTPS